MPRKRTNTKGKNWNLADRRKFRVGNRKGGVSALSMKTSELLKVLADEGKAKYHNNVVAVLKHRGNLNQ